MKKIFTFFLSIVWLVSNAQHADLNNLALNPQIVFTHVTIINVKDGKLNTDMTVVVSRNRISAVGKNKTLAIPKNASIINAQGKFLIPGLWDMHVHALGEKSKEILFPLFIANGVTGVRDMGTSGTLEMVKKMKADIANGKLLGPRVIAAGKILDGSNPKDPSASIAISSASEGRNAVRLLKTQGADFIKVYNGLSREAYFAIADEAKQQELSFSGHIPIYVTAAEASNSGQKSIEHLFGVHEACSSNENELTELLIKYSNQDPNYRRFLLSTNAVSSFNEKKATKLIQLFAKNHTWQCPTLLLQFLGCNFDDSSLIHANDTLLKYIYPELRSEWNFADSVRKIAYKEYDSKLKQLWSEDLIIMSKMHRYGVPMLAGTDAVAIVYQFPGFSLQQELALFVQTGYSPLEALQTATINPAKYLGKQKELGTIEKGKIADMVFLDANPLKDIQNTKKIWAVVSNGRYFDRSALDQLLEEVKLAASK